MLVQPYLFFNGRADEAIAFYREAVGATVGMLMRYRDAPEPPPPGMLPAGWDGKVMHAELAIGESVVMLSDGMADGGTQWNGFSLSLTVADDAEAERRFAALSAGGTVTMPLAKTFFTSRFGMCEDRFGVGWMVLARQA
ncbi:MAG: VOC family protein [Burkholderiales bacterium]